MQERRANTIVVRSFRVVFDLGLRRLFKVDRYRVPFPYGLPLRGLAYAAVVLLLELVLMRLVVVGELVRALPAPVRYVLLPGGVASVLLQVTPDGRSAHAAALAWARYRFSPTRLSGWRPLALRDPTVALGEVTFAPDERCSRYRAGRLAGPARVLLRYPARAWRAGRVLHIEQASDEPAFVGKQVTLERGQELAFHDPGGRWRKA